MKILFQFTGSIAAFKACQLVSSLVKADYSVQTVATKSAFEFVGRATLEGLTNRAVASEVYEPGHPMDHISLAREADLILLCPATANSINKLAAGIADDLIGTLFLANNFKKPYWVVPAMNTQMYEHPATQESLKKLSHWGARIFDTQDGRLACGEVGSGKMVEPDEVFKEIEKFKGTR